MRGNLGKGLRYEDQAGCYLAQRGLSLIQRNYRCRYGEIDLIMEDGEILCFVEVKYRRSRVFGGAADAISATKRRRLVKTALFYLAAHRQYADRATRFDALLLQRRPDGSNDIDWIKNAFYPE